MTSKALEHYATQARIAELEAEVARLKPDAERYQWLQKGEPLRVVCNNKHGKPIVIFTSDKSECVDWGPQLSIAIDAAIAISKGA